MLIQRFEKTTGILTPFPFHGTLVTSIAWMEGKTCRVCHGSDELLQPCLCRGSVGWIHRECLKQWQRQLGDMKNNEIKLLPWGKRPMVWKTEGISLENYETWCLRSKEIEFQEGVITLKLFCWCLEMIQTEGQTKQLNSCDTAFSGLHLC